MTQKEFVKMALDKLGGCAHLTDICVLAGYYIGDGTKAKDVKNNIRRELNSNPDLFCHVDGKPDGWWQTKDRKDEIDRLNALIYEKDAIIEEYKKKPTEDDFIARLLEKLDDCLAGKTKKSKKQVENTPTSIVVNGDYVVDKHVDNEVNGVASGGTGINVNKEKE